MKRMTFFSQWAFPLRAHLAQLSPTRTLEFFWACPAPSMSHLPRSCMRPHRRWSTHQLRSMAMDIDMKGITATSAGGMTTVATADGTTIIMVTTTDLPMAAPR
ncbi:hypothetical protein SAMN05446635_2846 [Burkholderia sp. OK233]|nr:hypothetical protein SAMN05446635_2846 [Burkholderia sp. OK233]